MAYPFLSPEWLDAANEVRARLADDMPPVEVVLSANLVVTGTPYGEDGVVHTHLDSSSGRVRIEPGLLEEPDVVLRLDYDAARVLMVDQDHVAIVDAFRDGRIHVDGDLEKLRALSTINHGEASVPQKLAEELRAITESEAPTRS